RRETRATIAPNNQQQVATSQPAQDSVLQGATFGVVSNDDPNYSGQTGVLVTAVEQNSRAAANGLRAGDLITAVNRRPVSSVDELQAQLGQGQRTVALNILRENQSLFLIVR